MTDSADPVRAELDVLVPALRDGDPDALARTYDLTADLLASIAFGVTRDPAAAEDVVQDAFLALIGAAPDFNGDGRALRAWLVHTVRNRAIDVVRRRDRGVVDHRSELPRDAATTDEHFVGQLDPAFERALLQLTPDQRIALILRHVEGLDGHEIGLALDRNRTAVYTLLRRAERQMRRALGEAFDTGASERPSP